MKESNKAWETPKLVEYNTVVEATGSDNKCGSGTDTESSQLTGTIQDCEPA